MGMMEYWNEIKISNRILLDVHVKRELTEGGAGLAVGWLASLRCYSCTSQCPARSTATDRFIES